MRARLDDLLTRYVSSFRNDPSALEDRIGEIDLADPAALANLQEAIGSPEVILGAITSPEQDALRPALEAIVAVVVGVVDHVVDVVGGELITDYPMLTEALRRRRVEAAAADRFVERLFGLELTQATYDRGSAFVSGVLEREGEDGLRRLWEGDEQLPTPAEVDAPGLWLARISPLGPRRCEAQRPPPDRAGRRRRTVSPGCGVSSGRAAGSRCGRSWWGRRSRSGRRAAGRGSRWVARWPAA